MKYHLEVTFLGTTIWILGSFLLLLNYLTSSHHLLVIGSLLFFSGLAVDIISFIAKLILTKS